MNTPSERKIRELLADNAPVAPPPGLADKIKAEIPADLAAATTEPPDAGTPDAGTPDAGTPDAGTPDAAAPKTGSRQYVRRFDARRWLPLAATVMVAVGVGLLAPRLLHESAPTSGEVAEHRPTEAIVLADGEREGRESAVTRGDAASVDARSVDDATRDADRSPAAPEPAPATAPPPPTTTPPPPAAPAEKLADGVEFRGGSPRVEAEEGAGSSRASEQRSLKKGVAEESRARLRQELKRGRQGGVASAADESYAVQAPARQVEPEPRSEEAGAELQSLGYVAPSTGGTAEPNDAPYGDVFFRGYGTNPFIDTEDDALSTFGLDVDTGSYTVVRRYLTDGHLPPPEAVRVEEMINYFDYGDEPPAEGDFAIRAQGAPSPFAHGERYYLLRFHLHGRELADADRRPALLTFVVDVSGSMARGNRLGLVRQALGLLIDQLRPDDRVALVVYGDRGRVVLPPTGDRDRLRRALDDLRSGGSTNAEEGLTLGYQLTARHRRAGEIHRVILCSDGVANVGDTSAGSIWEAIEGYARQGIELTTVGFGMGNYNDVLMERLADTGNGRYAYVDTLDEARRIFVEELTGTLQTLAAEARVQVEFDPESVTRYRLLGYENRDVPDERFRDDTVDAGEIGVGHTVTALYEVKLRRPPKKRDHLATLHLRYGAVDAGEVVELEHRVTGADFTDRWQDAPPALQLTAVVAEFAEILKGSYWAKGGDLEALFRRAQRLSAHLAGDRRVADFVTLVGRAAELAAASSEE